MTTTGFPNMFMILGPNGPFTNLPPSIETQVEWISDCVKHAEQRGAQSIEATPEAESAWTGTCTDIAAQTLFAQGDSWIFGANIPGKPNTVMFYMAGLGAYRDVLGGVVKEDYRGFELRHPSNAVRERAVAAG